jgi:hypothetical protein
MPLHAAACKFTAINGCPAMRHAPLCMVADLASCALQQPEHRLNGFDEFDVADRLRQRGWVRVPSQRCL